MNVVLGPADVVTAYGWGLDALWSGLMSGGTAIAPVTWLAERGFPTHLAAEVPGLTPAAGESRVWAMLRRLLAPLAGTLEEQTPVILATTVGEIECVEQSVLQGRAELAAGASPAVLLARIKDLLGLRGPGFVVSAACASSAAALTQAGALVRRGAARRVLVVTGDAVSELVYSGFTSLLSLAERPAAPFDADRAGLTLGDAAAWALVSAGEDAPDAAAAIVGWGNTSDAFHMTAPDAQGRGLVRAIHKACAMAGRDPGEIRMIAAHGTATVFSDAMEMAAFRASLPAPVPAFSVKGGVGHNLGAAGLVQILVAARALAEGVVPPTVGLRLPDEAAEGWACGQAVRLAAGGAGEAGRLALSTNSGFGGVNTAILLEGRA
jgi:3-oxoacyl-[acyl-carrier-protein] synthase II